MPLFLFGRRRVAAFPIASAIFLLGCGETTANVRLSAGSISVVSAGTLTGVVGQLLSDPVVLRVLGSDNQPLSRVQVSFGASSGGSVDPATATSDNDGMVRTRWTLGRTAGAQTLTASAGGSITRTVSATAAAGRAATVAVVGGDGQLAAAGTAVAQAPSVRVTDASGNLVEGASVTFTVLAGGGRVTDALRRTNAQGVASVTAWILGTTAGVQTLVARVEESAVTNNPVVFTATATAGVAAQVLSLSATSQSAAAGTNVSAPPSVRVVDLNGNAIPNAQVAFSVTAGGGQLTGNTQLTNAQGTATVGSWTLGTIAGTNRVIASVSGLTDVAFTATGTAGAAVQLVLLAGEGQQAQSGRAVAVAPSVSARDARGNGVPGVVVTFAITAGGGTAVSGRQTTDAAGTADVGAWFLGPAPGVNTMSASAVGLAPITFTATATPGNPVSMVSNSSTAQSGAAGSAVTSLPSVIVRDLSGNPVPGVSVAFTVASGGGTVVGSPVLTSAGGVATVTSWTLGTAVGANSVVASASGLPSVTFNATASAGDPATVVAVSGDNQVAIQGTAVALRPTVRVTDANGNVVAGATVTFAVTGGGGSVAGVTQSTDALGIATVGSWTLGSAAPNTLTATVTGSAISGNPVTFTAQSATAIVLTSVPTGPLTLGTNFSVTVQVQNSAGAPVALAGVQLTILIASGGGTLNGAVTATTDAAGAATFTINVTGTAGVRTFGITGTGLLGAGSAAITFN